MSAGAVRAIIRDGSAMPHEADDQSGPAIAACLILGIDLARSLADLGAFWRDNQAALQLLRHVDLGPVVARKDARKVELSSP